MPWGPVSTAPAGKMEIILQARQSHGPYTSKYACHCRDVCKPTRKSCNHNLHVQIACYAFQDFWTNM
jgi:hypothetical protein